MRAASSAFAEIAERPCSFGSPAASAIGSAMWDTMQSLWQAIFGATTNDAFACYRTWCVWYCRWYNGTFIYGSETSEELTKALLVEAMRRVASCSIAFIMELGESEPPKLSKSPAHDRLATSLFEPHRRLERVTPYRIGWAITVEQRIHGLGVEWPSVLSCCAELAGRCAGPPEADAGAAAPPPRRSQRQRNLKRKRE